MFKRKSWICTAPEMIPTPKWSPTLKWSPNRPWNDPDPEMIPTFLIVDPETIPKELANGGETWDCGLLVIRESKAILAYNLI